MTKAAYKIKYLFGAYSYRGFVSMVFIVWSMAAGASQARAGAHI